LSWMHIYNRVLLFQQIDMVTVILLDGEFNL